jgi:DNA (cytosine-5)-methyltransferase 1
MKNPAPYRFSDIRAKAGLSISQVSDLTGYSLRTVYRWERDEADPRKAVVERLLAVAENRGVFNVPNQKGFTFIDLFAGIGGMRMGFESVGGQCVFTSEWNKFSRLTYQANFPCGHDVAGDITRIDAGDIPPHDVLVAGFPCQPFSIAGVTKKNALGRPHGFLCETQGTLFFDVARIIEYHRPAAFLLENVKNLCTHDRGRTFRVIRETLSRLGYHFDWRVIDAKGWVPQHRERIFIVGFRDDTGFSFDDFEVAEPATGPRLNSILHPEDGSEEAEPPYTEGSAARVSSRYMLSDHLWKYLQDYAAKHRAQGNGFGFGLVGPEDAARTLSARYYKDGSEILVRRESGNPRRLTPRECARLMGFDRPEAPFRIPVSDTQAYKQFGNAVVVPVVEAVASLMLPHIIGKSREVTGQLYIPFPGIQYRATAHV